MPDLPALPDSAVAVAAREAAARFCSPALLNHSIRSYLWAAAYGRGAGIAFDAELLWVAAMFHDLGLTESFDNHALPFEDAGGHASWVFGAGAGWSPERRRRASEIIVRHMQDDIAPGTDPESHLLQVSTSWDVSGRRPELFPEALRRDILAGHPRLDFGREMTARFEDQARRKPACSAAACVRDGIARRISTNPLG